jgi:hypothetical protein
MACAERRFAVVQEHVKQGNAIPRRTSIGGERQARRHDAHLPSGSQTGSQSRSFVSDSKIRSATRPARTEVRGKWNQ